jgi:hypothetical protein
MNQATLVNGVNVDPVIPNEFWSFFPGATRPKDHLKWLGKPFILTVANPHFPGGNRYDVYCLEAEGTSDRPSVWGMFGTLEEAVQRAKEGPPWREHVRIRGEKSSEKVCENLDIQIGRGFSETG